MYKMDLALSSVYGLICHKTKPNHIIDVYMNKIDVALRNLPGLICHKTTNQMLCRYLPGWSNTDIQATNTTVEMDCVIGVTWLGIVNI